MRALSLTWALAATVGSLALGPGLAGQELAPRLEGRVPPSVARAVLEIAQGARARGLPVEPLIQKALEGGAKQVAAERVIAAVEVLATRLDQAQVALRDAGTAGGNAEAVESGAYALSAGFTPGQVRDLARATPSPLEPALTLRVAATLAALGVPPRRGILLLEHLIARGGGPSAVLDLPSEVELGMARGATAADAAEDLDRGEGEQDAHGAQGERGREDRQGRRRGQEGEHPRKP